MPIEKNRKKRDGGGVLDRFALSRGHSARHGVLKGGMRWGRAITVACAFALAAAACGARTALIAESTDAMPMDAAMDVRRDANTTGSPYSMGVDRSGVAYALFDSGQVFRLSTATAACSATSYVPNQLGWTTFGMGYASTPDGGEALYVTEANFNTPSKGLGAINTMSFKLGFINTFSATLPRCELTGNANRRPSPVTTLTGSVVGAGVSTCAPQ